MYWNAIQAQSWKGVLPFNKNMRCIETTIWHIRSLRSVCLIRTWDVLKLCKRYRNRVKSICLIRTWDVLKRCETRCNNYIITFNKNMRCIETVNERWSKDTMICLIRTWDVLKHLRTVTNRVIRLFNKNMRCIETVWKWRNCNSAVAFNKNMRCIETWYTGTI